MRAVVIVLRARFRQYWKSWLALSLLAAVPALLAARSHPARLLRAE